MFPFPFPLKVQSAPAFGLIFVTGRLQFFASVITAYADDAIRNAGELRGSPERFQVAEFPQGTVDEDNS
jgi:hypothetical protein